MCSLNDAVQQNIVGVFNVDQVHARGRHHDITRCHIGHANDAFEHRTRLGVNNVVLLGFSQGVDQLIS